MLARFFRRIHNWLAWNIIWAVLFIHLITKRRE